MPRIMSTLPGTHEITELTEKHDTSRDTKSRHLGKPLKKHHSIEDDINRLFEAMDVGNSRRVVEQRSRDKSAMKRPMRVSPFQVSNIGISESVSLKQALRGLCISQASEMAAVKKRMYRPSVSPAISENGAIRKLYKAVVVEANEDNRSNGEDKGDFVEISLVPENNHDCHKGKTVNPPPDSSSEKSRTREKGEFSQSSKSSIGEYSSTTSHSEESTYLSNNRPHMSKDLRWEAIRCVQKRSGSLSLRHFKMLRKIGGGDIGTVYLSELIGTSCLFAVKIMDNECLVGRKKLMRAQTEREVMEILDHPFLPTLYAHFATSKFSCLVMEYCPGGDLHVLRQKQSTRSFPEKAARFYAAEVLLALEYLHMLGVVYRDLKPENVLVREDGHIMLSDFDLSLRCNISPTLLISSSPTIDPPKKTSSPCSDHYSSCMIDHFCLQPSWQLSCFTPRFLSRTRTLKSEPGSQVIVVEPTDARSNSFVGTHEYLAPEVIKGEGHGSAVDWWAFGIFLYELLYGWTPFKGSSNEETITNVVSKSLEFPHCAAVVGRHARDLIRRLLRKEVDGRMGAEKGAAEIKRHPFFDGVNWALIRCETPPEMVGVICEDISQRKIKELAMDEMEFEMF